MGKFRSKLKGQTKGKRWPKGQSSSSNPETQKYRNQAKSRFFQANLGASNLTTSALQKHDALQTYSVPSKVQQPEQMEAEESQSVYSAASSYETMKTFASDWSDCSNMSFKRFLNVFRADSALHKEMLAILAAVTEVIKQNGGSETPTEYYCSLITTMEQILEAEVKNEDQITAVLSLINMGIKSVPTPVIQSSFNSVTSKLLVILQEYSGSENNVIIKSIMGIFAVLLKNQELAVWQHMETLQIFGALLNPFCIHTKPKWRKAAQHAVVSILSAETFSSGFSPAAEKVAEFCTSTLESCLGSNSNTTVLVSSIQAGQTTILHTLGLLKDTIIYFNKNNVKVSCETVLRLMSLNYPIVTSCGMQVLHSLFMAQRAVTNAKLNGQVITALYDYQPSAVDAQPTLAWLAVMQQAHVHLADVDLSQCCIALPRIFNTISQLWLSQKPDIVMGATRALEMLFRDAIGQIVANEKLLKDHEVKIVKCIQIVELGLGYQYHHAWPQVLHITSVMFEICGTACTSMLLNVLKTLSELRDSYKFSYNNELEHAVGSAVKSMGPEAVLNVISLRKDNGELNLDRSWLLPVLRENIHRSTLGFWVRAILPLAIFSQKRSVELGAQNDGIGAHSAELLHLQLWNLLPSFCNNATDIHANFKSVAKVLGMAISDRKELRLAVLASLRKLIATAKESADENDLKELGRFDKNYLPILFNLYTTKPVGTDEEGQRLAAMDTIKAYLPIARTELTEQMFSSALERLLTPSVDDATEIEDAYVKESIMDLIKALLPYQSVDNIEKIYESCIKSLPEIENSKMQKKTYRLLEEICGSNASGCKEFLKKHRKFVQKLLLKSLSTSAVSSKAARLRCLNFLLKAQPQLDHESTLIRSTMPEAIMGCKDHNQRCRLIAYEVLKTIGEILLTHNQMQEYITLVIAGLAGTAELMSATLLALSIILHHFSGALGQQNIEVILENALHLMVVPTRDIVGSCLSFVKVFITSLPLPMVGSHMPAIIKAMCAMADDCQRHFRIKVRNMLSRLVRKFGADAIAPHIPSTDTTMYKRLRNQRKLQNRLKRRKDQQLQRSSDDDDDMEDEFMVKARAKTVEEILADSDSDFDDNDKPHQKKPQRKYNAFIEEDADSIVDFKDPSIASKITTTRPQNNVPSTQNMDASKKDRGFKTSSDGRLIIADDSDSDDNGRQGRGKKFVTSDSDSDDDTLSKAATEILRDRKRKHSSVSSVASSFQSKYKPGGSGIHRNVASSAGSVKMGTGADYKAKKADGDVKKGKFDPFAYVPLQRSALNKRKKLKNAGQFKNIIGAARTGSKKGMKARKRLGK